MMSFLNSLLQTAQLVSKTESVVILGTTISHARTESVVILQSNPTGGTTVPNAGTKSDVNF